LILVAWPDGNLKKREHILGSNPYNNAQIG
jgi:hypothetical protein